MRVLDNRLNTVEAAEVLGFHRSTVERMCREGRIPAKKIRNNIWSIDKNELEKYMADKGQKADCILDLGQKLKSARDQLGLSQPQLAVILGVSYAAISRWEHGNRTPWMKHSQQILFWLEQINQ
jgi:excisionase family DNA binding protein